MTEPSPIDLERRYCARNYDPLPLVITRGEGCHLWDDRGIRYLDMMGAYSAVSFGHGHPRLVRVLAEQAARLSVVSRAYYTDRLGPFVQRACELSGLAMGLPMNTGAEAVETALKAARRWAYEAKGVPEDGAEVICCDSNFHGRTLTLVGLSSEAHYRRHFGPFPPGFVRIPYGDAEALERAITADTAAFLVEPIQGEGGIIVPPSGYLRRAAELCRAHRVLLICDEVQTGLGRTGRFLACQHEGVVPDGLTLGKALGGGLLPVSMFLASREFMGVFDPGSHGSTFGGNPLAAAVGLEALNLLIEERLPERAATLGDHLLAQLRRIDSPIVREVRGRGLFVGLLIDTARIEARDLCLRLAAHGVLTKDTHENVIRLCPPLIISEDELDWAIERIAATLREVERSTARE